jgi:hypothetical protein
MKRSPGKLILFTALCISILACFSLVMAGTTGKIKGVVIDQETGEPIPGASVMVVGTTLGSVTDLDGRYLIQMVSPGKHAVRATSIGYQTVEAEDLEVVTDITTEQNFELPKAAIDLNKVIKVTAKGKGIDKYVHSSQVTITSDAIKAMPVQNVDQLLQQTAGVVTTNEGEIVIRGGRAGEVAYIVDGVSISDPLGGYGPANLGLSLTSGSIQEISIIKDGFDPEYGNALSGIVKITTQTGSAERTNMTVQYITDDFGNTNLNKYSENYDNIYFTISGPDPILKNRILPALGLNLFEDKEVTYFVYAEVTKTGTPYNYDEFDTPLTEKQYASFDLFGIPIPERQYNDYTINANLMMKPLNNMKLIFSYKSSVNRQTEYYSTDWQYRYTPNTAPVGETKWQSFSAELTHQISKNMHYYVKASYYNRDVYWKPGDPNNPGQGMDPDEFLQYDEFERYEDYDRDGVYDPPEPIINIFPDSVDYGKDLSTPAYTYTYPYYISGQGYQWLPILGNDQAGYTDYYDFRFNSGHTPEGEPYVDVNGNGQWDQGDYLFDTNGNGTFDYDRRDVVDSHDPEPYIDGDQSLGEPFTDVNNDGVYTEGIDIFIMSEDPDLNQDLDRSSDYTAPYDPWQPGIPFIDMNGNGIYDEPNYSYDPGEPFTDVNGNGKYDYGGSSNFLNVGNYEAETVWHHRQIEQYTLETRLYRQLGNHELKAGAALYRKG